MVDHGVETWEKDPGFVASLMTAVALKAITRKGKEGRPSWIDRQQRNLIGLVVRFQSEFGLVEKFQVDMPTPEALEEAVDYWENQFTAVMPSSFPHLGVGEINGEIERRAEQYMTGIMAGAEVVSDGISETEKAMARNLFTAYVSGVENDELKRILVGSANATCQDMAGADVRALLSVHTKGIQARWSELRSQKPGRYFIADKVTSVVMGRALATDVVATTWNVSPAGIELMAVDPTKGFTVSTIPWESIVVSTEEKAGEPGRIRMVVKLPKFVKTLNTVAFGLLRPLFEKYSRIGGEVRLDIIGEEGDAGLIMVRDPKRVKDQLVRMKELHNSMAETLGVLDKILNDSEPKRPFSPRPRVVVGEFIKITSEWRDLELEKVEVAIRKLYERQKPIRAARVSLMMEIDPLRRSEKAKRLSDLGSEDSEMLSQLRRLKSHRKQLKGMRIENFTLSS